MTQRRKKLRRYREPTQLQLRRNDLKHFDMLPAELRDRLNDCNIKFCSATVYKWWHHYGMSFADIVRQLRANEQHLAEHWDRS
jgi:hypothetical protein